MSFTAPQKPFLKQDRRVMSSVVQKSVLYKLGRIFSASKPQFEFSESIQWLWRYSILRKRPFSNLLLKKNSKNGKRLPCSDDNKGNYLERYIKDCDPPFNLFLSLQKGLLRQMLYLQSQWIDFKNLFGS